jgi:endo-alpha-1,4-polygalactosaminidase (GH114 family)
MLRVIVVCMALSAPSLSAHADPVFKPGASWDWQLTEPLDLDAKVEIIDLHPDLVSEADVAALKARGVYTICYVSVGTVEKTSSDRDLFPVEIVGKTYEDWPDEKFLDVSRIDLLLPIMRARFARCRDKGFDAVEPDNMDVHDNESGFSLSATDTVAYVRALAAEAHALGLAMGQKNVPALSGELVGDLDFAITESCHQDGWCNGMKPWFEAGKPVLAAEYDDRQFDLETACAEARRLNLSMILKDRDLTARRETCPLE